VKRPAYVGRFAPSPTGPLHRGSLVAAVASFLDARAHGGHWLLRIEDIDPPREIPGAADTIIRQLETHGLLWDGAISHQSRHGQRYQSALDQLARAGLLYDCGCNRQRLATLHGRYDGACRPHRYGPGAPITGALRLRTQAGLPPGASRDFMLGVVHGDPASDGDFIVRRRDGLIAYQLAVAVDDAAQGITHVLRGIDLLDSTPRQQFILHCLQLPAPVYGHIPLVLDAEGRKLSKQNRAPALTTAAARANVHWALSWLGLRPPADLQAQAPRDQLAWGIAHWARERVAHRTNREE